MGACGCCLASAIDPKEAQGQVSQEAPEILVEGEEFLFAFAYTRDQVYFTSLRILIKNKKGIMGDSVAWQTIPYHAVKAFSVETAGSLDPSLEMRIWASGISNGEFDSDGMNSPSYDVSFKSNDGKVDVFALQTLLNWKVFNPDGPKVEVPPNPQAMGEQSSSFMDLVCGDAKAIDPKIVERQLRCDPPVLLGDEEVDMAFRCGRDTTCLTSRRWLRIDVKGMTGKKVEYVSLPWGSVVAFAVETPGMFLDRDCEISLFNTISHIDEHQFAVDLRNSSTDIMAIQRYLSDKLLGQDTAPPSEHAQPRAGQEDQGGGWQAWLAGNSRQIDAAEAERKFKQDVPLLQGCETCEMAFKGARDMVLFTTKRLITVDAQGMTGKKVEYKSFPWACVQAFAVQSAGSWLDTDAEMLIWTNIFHSYHTVEHSDNNTEYFPEPGQSLITVDFAKDQVDLPAIGRYLAGRCAKLGAQSSQPPAPMATHTEAQVGAQGGIERFLNWLGDNYRQCDPAELNAQLHGDCSLLLPEEQVQMGFICGRDTVVLTTHRALKIDTKGFTGKKVLYLSVPWTKVKSWEVESAGSFDMDGKMSLSIKSAWYNREIGTGLDVDFGKGRADVLAINRYVSEQVIGAGDGSSSMPRERLPDRPEGQVSQLLSWLGDDYKQISKEEASEKFASDPALLLPDEAVDLAFKCRRDVILLTTKRALKIDTKGWTGQKVNYNSMPYKAVRCFSVTGAPAHPFDRDCEVEFLTDTGPWGFDVKKDQGDIMATYTVGNKKVVLEGMGK